MNRPVSSRKTSAGLLALWLVSVPLAAAAEAQSAGSGDAAAHVAQGRALLRAGKPKEAEALLKRAAAERGNSIEALGWREMRPLRKDMQIVFQDPYGSLSPRMTVAEIIAEGLGVHMPDLSLEDRDRRVTRALIEVGLDAAMMHRYPHEFSGGQRQRLAIARAIALEPEFILLDEPTSALDLSVQAQIIELLRKLQDEKGLSYLFISHDLKVVKALCHRVMVMQYGKIVEQGPVNEVLENPKTEYTSRLVRAAFEIAA